MDARQLLADQRITIKRGRMNNLGFEPAYNSFFDLYLSTRYFDPPLLDLEDVTFFLYLRKNLNDYNPEWKMPTYRQMKQKFGLSVDKIRSMMSRLEHAKLLQVETHWRNNYLLSDPVPIAEEFVLLIEEGLLQPREKRRDNENKTKTKERESKKQQRKNAPNYGTSAEDKDEPYYGTTVEPKLGTQDEPYYGTDQQTSDQQTSDEQLEVYTKAWDSALAMYKQHLPAQSYEFIRGTRVIGADNNIVTIGAATNSAKEWIETRLARTMVRKLNIELSLAGMPDVDDLRIVVE